MENPTPPVRNPFFTNSANVIELKIAALGGIPAQIQRTETQVALDWSG